MSSPHWFQELNDVLSPIFMVAQNQVYSNLFFVFTLFTVKILFQINNVLMRAKKRGTAARSVTETQNTSLNSSDVHKWKSHIHFYFSLISFLFWYLRMNYLNKCVSKPVTFLPLLLFKFFNPRLKFELNVEWIKSQLWNFISNLSWSS